MNGLQKQPSKPVTEETAAQQLVLSSQTSHVQEGIKDPGLLRQFNQSINTLVKSRDPAEQQTATRTITETMRSSGFSEQQANAYLNFARSFSDSHRFLIDNNKQDQARQLGNDVASGKINSSEQVLQQMERMGYHEFVMQEQNVLAQNEALVKIVFAGIMSAQQSAAHLAMQNMVLQMYAADEAEREKLRDKLAKEMEKGGMRDPEQRKEAIANAERMLGGGDIIGALVAIGAVEQSGASDHVALAIKSVPRVVVGLNAIKNELESVSDAPGMDEKKIYIAQRINTMLNATDMTTFSKRLSPFLADSYTSEQRIDAAVRILRDIERAA